jgi:hypothetical protein
MENMEHICGPGCEQRMEMDAAAAALAEASALLSRSIMGSSVEMIEVYYAHVRAAKAKFRGSMAEFKEHLKVGVAGRKTGGIAA